MRNTLSRYYEKLDRKISDITDEVPFAIPENWNWCRLGALINLTMGQSPMGETINTAGNGIEFHQGKLFFGEIQLNRSPYATTAPQRVAHKNSLLICVRAPVGIVNITNREICIGRGLAAIEPLSSITVEFLAHWITANKNALLQKATGSTFVAVTVDQIKSLYLPVPPLPEQKRIYNVIEQIMSVIETVE